MAEKVSEQPSEMADQEASPSQEAPSTSNQSSPSTSGGGGGSWWGSWIDQAKTKSASVLEAVKKDLDELTTVVKTEATIAGSAIAETLNLQEPDSTANTVKKSLSSFFGQVSEVLSPSPIDDSEDTEAVLITRDGAVTLTGFHKHLAELQMNDDIYLIEPDLELVEKYQRWMEVVDQDQFTQQRLDRQLQGSDILKEKYERLVPKQVTHMQFWQRYLFKRALLEDALANAEQAERRAKQDKVTTKGTKKFVQTEQPKRVVGDADGEEPEVVEEPKGVKNDDEALQSIDEELSQMAVKVQEVVEDDFTSCANVELSEEEQARLLAEYEQEIQERERKTAAVTPKKGQQQQAQGKKQGNQKGGKGKNQQQQQQKGKKAQPQKDDSDESWEKEFDLE